MKEQLISFDIAKLAKEKGFECIMTDDTSFYQESLINDEWTRTGFSTNFFFSRAKKNNNTRYVLAPTQSLLQKWLREEHDIWVTVTFGYQIEWEIRDCRPKNLSQIGGIFVWNIEPTLNDGLCHTYEEALEEGLIQALKLV